MTHCAAKYCACCSLLSIALLACALFAGAGCPLQGRRALTACAGHCCTFRLALTTACSALRALNLPSVVRPLYALASSSLRSSIAQALRRSTAWRRSSRPATPTITTQQSQLSSTGADSQKQVGMWALQGEHEVVAARPACANTPTARAHYGAQSSGTGCTALLDAPHVLAGPKARSSAGKAARASSDLSARPSTLTSTRPNGPSSPQLQVANATAAASEAQCLQT